MGVAGQLIGFYDENDGAGVRLDRVGLVPIEDGSHARENVDPGAVLGDD
jgi:hypothetical protein